VDKAPFAKRITAEAIGTALLLAAVVGSGIMGERSANGNVAIALLANTLATGAALVALILTFGPISGAHFNPAVTLADASQGGLSWREVPGYILAQIVGAFVGVACAHLMFALPLFMPSRHLRAGTSAVNEWPFTVQCSYSIARSTSLSDGLTNWPTYSVRKLSKTCAGSHRKFSLKSTLCCSIACLHWRSTTLLNSAKSVLRWRSASRARERQIADESKSFPIMNPPRLAGFPL
jgi:major intrinsic protein